MFLRKALNKKTGRTYLSIVHGYRDKDGKPKSKVVESIGYLDELKNKYNDPISHFEKMASELDKERRDSKKVTISVDMEARVNRGDANRKNYGHVIFSKIYHELEIDRFLKNARRHENFKFNTDSIMRLLVFNRLLFPGSKRAATLNKSIFFDNFRFSLDDVYNALTHFNKVADALQHHLHEQVTGRYGREADIVLSSRKIIT
jgi:hypothetical protein